MDTITATTRPNRLGTSKVQVPDLTPAQKLAAVLMLLGEDTASLIFKSFDDHERELIAAEMANLPLLSLDQQTEILKDFTELAIKANTSLGGSVEYTQSVLEKAVGMFKAADIMSRVSTKRASVAAMQQIIDMDALSIANLLKEEQPQTIALIISYLTAQKASEVLRLLPEHVQEQVIERLANLSATPIEVVETVGEVLSKKIGPKLSRALNQTGGVKSAAAVLNAMQKAERQEILNRLDERVPELVRAIRNKMFTFEDLVTLDNRTLQKILREVDPSTLAIALSAAHENLRNALLGAISKRAADAVLDEISNLGRLSLREIEAAQDAITDVVRKLESEGEINLQRE